MTRRSDMWERVIRAECQQLQHAGRAGVERNWEAPRVPGTSVSREKSKPDFSGWGPGGRHVVFEAKSVLVEGRFDKKNMKPHQTEHLRVADAGGALAFVLVLDGAYQRWLLPIAAFGADRSSVPLELTSPMLQRGEWERRSGSKFVWVGESWLDTAERLRLV